MRQIDADALERKAKRTATEAWKMSLKAPVETTLNQFIDWVKSAPTVGGWISVKDRLPKPNEAVIVCLYDKEIEFGYRTIAWLNTCGAVWDSNDEGINLEYKVTHWMPLPTPPEEKRNDD